MEEVLKFLQGNAPFYFATVEESVPKVRPFGLCLESDGKIYFGIGTFKKAFQQLLKNPKVEICTTNKDREWIRLHGTAVMDDNDKVLEKAFEMMPFLKEMYNEKTGKKLGLFYLKDAVAEIADMKGGFREIKL